MATFDAAIHEAEWLNAWAVLNGGENRQSELNADSNAATDPAMVRSIVADALAVLTDQIRIDGADDPFEPGSTAILVLNALGWDRTDVIELHGDPLELIDPGSPDNAPIHQTHLDDQGRLVRLYLVEVPAYGYRAYRTRKGLPGRVVENTLSATRRTLESDRIRVELTADGGLESITDRDSGREWLSPESRDQLLKFAAPDWMIDDWQVIDSGPIRASVEVVYRKGDQQATRRISLWRHTRRVDLQTDTYNSALETEKEVSHFFLESPWDAREAARRPYDIDSPLRMVRFRPSAPAMATLPAMASLVRTLPADSDLVVDRVSLTSAGVLRCTVDPQRYSGSIQIIIDPAMLAQAVQIDFTR